MMLRRRRREQPQPGNASPPGQASPADRSGGGPQIRVTAMPSDTAARQAAAGGGAAEMNRLGLTLKMSGREDKAAEWFRRAGGPLGEAMAQRLLGGDGGPGTAGA